MSEQIRSELSRRAEEVDTSAAVRQRVLAGVAPRRRGWVTPVLGAAAAVVVTVVGLQLVPQPDIEPVPLPNPGSGSPTPDGWREESWGDLTVSVPDEWGWGSAPIGRLGICGSPSDGPGYVGRPIMLSDACVNYSPESPSLKTAQYVWLGADLDQGVIDLGGGRTQETVAAFGTTLTVGTFDDELRATIIESARKTDLCAGTFSYVPEPTSSGDTDALEPDGLVVCAYRRDEPGGPVNLVYAAHVDQAAARTWENLTDDRSAMYRCADRGPGNEWAVLRFSEGAQFGEAVYDLGAPCPEVRLADGSGSALTGDLVRPWAVGGIPYTVYGPAGGKGAMLDSFIPGWG